MAHGTTTTSTTCNHLNNHLDCLDACSSPCAGVLAIDVLDRGSRMNDAVLNNALLPFYSTKRNGASLALVREIVEAHGRRIALLNRDGGGLCESLSLPCD